MTSTETLNSRQKELYDLWVMLGRDTEDPELQALMADAAKPARQSRQENSERHAKKVREAEAVLKHLHSLNSLIQTECQNCGEHFATNYHYNKHCSDECLRRTLHELGLEWRPEKAPEERWQGQPPSVVKPETLKLLKKWAHEILAWDEPVIEKPVIDPKKDPFAFLESL